MSDLTEQFQQTLSLLRHDQRFSSVTQPSQTKKSSEQVARTNAFREIFTQIRSIFTTITQLRNILLQHRKDYINIHNPLENNENVLSDLQRDEIDRTFETFQRDLPSMIMHIRLQCASSQKLPDQMREHCLNVTQLMESYAKRVCNSHNQMKKLRTQRAIDRQKVFRLASDLPESLNQLRNRIRPRTDSQSEAENVPLSPTMNQPVVTKQTYHYEDQGLLNSESETLLDSLTEEEMQAFQQENEQLYDEMNALNEEVKKIEGQVVEIAQLQELFTEKVLQQEQELNRVNMTVIGTTENIKGGNQHLREAMKKNADFRVSILFFIITLGFVILFLDWYNP